MSLPRSPLPSFTPQAIPQAPQTPQAPQAPKTPKLLRLPLTLFLSTPVKSDFVRNLECTTRSPIDGVPHFP